LPSFRLEAKLPDVAIDEFRRLREAAVDQDMATRTRDQHGRQPGRADVIGVSEKTDRIARGVPGVAGLADFRRIRREWRLNLLMNELDEIMPVGPLLMRKSSPAF
jgi:hypothetical protein